VAGKRKKKDFTQRGAETQRAQRRGKKNEERFLSAQADTFAGSERERKSVGLLRSK
jgi:hypothetical protein